MIYNYLFILNYDNVTETDIKSIRKFLMCLMNAVKRKLIFLVWGLDCLAKGISLCLMNKSNRRKFIGTAATLIVGTATASAMPVLDKKYPIIHHVFFWLKNPESKEDKAKLIEGIKALKKIETVGALHVGTVADTEKRAVIDQSWSVSELIFFADLKGQATYQTHPLHVEFVKKYSHLWSKVVVYDVVDA